MLADLVLQLLVVAFGLLLVFQPEVLTDPGAIAGAPSLEDLLFAFPLVLVAFSGIDASSGPRRARSRSAAAGCGG